MSIGREHPSGRSSTTGTGLGPAGAPLTTGVHGRGASLNPASRFETISLAQLPAGAGDDDLVWQGVTEHPDDQQPGAQGAQAEPPANAAPRLTTRVFRDRSKTIINPIDSPDLNFRWSINPYRGCEHGCVYCYARPTHEYLGLSSGLDFETQIFAKLDAPELLRRELSKPSWTPEPISMSGITDTYQPLERRLRITRGCLEVMSEFGQPVSIVTKSALILRDLDIIAPMAARGLAQVAVSLTTLDAELAAKMEPRASSPAQRLRAIRELTAAGVPVAAMVAPVIPAINDREIPAILQAAARAGADIAAYVLLRLPWQNKALFQDWLTRHFPQRAAHVEALIRGTRDGKLYRAAWGTRMRGEGAFAEQLESTFSLFARRYGLNRPRPALRQDLFKVPNQRDRRQLSLFTQ